MAGQLGIASRNARNHLAQTQTRLNKRVNTIASGSRINQAADDPAGMTVATTMETSQRLQKQAIRNANDGISVIQKAETSLETIGGLISRMRRLAVHAASDTSASEDKLMLDSEYKNMIKDIRRIASISTYNDHNLLKGGGDFSIQIGEKQSDVFNIDLNSIAATLGALDLTLGVQSMLDGLGEFKDNTIDALQKAERLVSTRRSYLGALHNRMGNIISKAMTNNENLAQGSSVISNADYAHESAAVTKDMVLQDAGLAAVSQARSITSSIMSILT